MTKTKSELLKEFNELKAPEVKIDINSGCSYCSYCSDCSYCSSCSSCSSCSYCSDCSDCSYCSYCSSCSRCSYCLSCSYCSSCSYCLRLENGILCKGLKFEYGDENAYNSNKYWILNKEVSKEEFENVKKEMQ
jgi:hypothetical protein